VAGLSGRAHAEWSRHVSCAVPIRLTVRRSGCSRIACCVVAMRSWSTYGSWQPKHQLQRRGKTAAFDRCGRGPLMTAPQRAQHCDRGPPARPTTRGKSGTAAQRRQHKGPFNCSAGAGPVHRKTRPLRFPTEDSEAQQR